TRPERRDYLLSVFGPFSLLLLMAVWSCGVILGFALLQLGTGAEMSGGETGFGARLYASAATFFTVGYGDVVATTGLGRFFSMLEAGMGFGMF
ncbi:potassium channel family protein, partial [Acinetobacter baumannii]